MVVDHNLFKLNLNNKQINTLRQLELNSKDELDMLQFR